jgi:hypothetical protein
MFGFLKMSKGQADGELNVSKNKDCTTFRKVWLLQLGETGLPFVHKKCKIKTGAIFTYRDPGDSVCTNYVSESWG